VSEAAVQAGRHAEHPLVILVSRWFDASRAPAGKTPGGVLPRPDGSGRDQTEAMNVRSNGSRPAFGTGSSLATPWTRPDSRRTTPTMLAVDINGGAGDSANLLRDRWSPCHPWRTPLPGVYLCSSSTPPGGGVHGMCGWHAAQAVLHREGR